MQASKNKNGGYHRTDRCQTERRRADPEDQLRRLKETVNAGCDAFFARRGIAYRWRW
jgi:hypothetical protein